MHDNITINYIYLALENINIYFILFFSAPQEQEY